jgi:hypothetical protein
MLTVGNENFLQAIENFEINIKYPRHRMGDKKY